MTRAQFEGGVRPGEHEEGLTTKRIEQFTSQIPSGTYLALAVGSMTLSALLYSKGRKSDAQFVSAWAPTILLLGLYNKIVKLQGSD
jgi:hypothetical protein